MVYCVNKEVNISEESEFKNLIFAVSKDSVLFDLNSISSKNKLRNKMMVFYPDSEKELPQEETSITGIVTDEEYCMLYDRFYKNQDLKSVIYKGITHSQFEVIQKYSEILAMRSYKLILPDLD